MPGKGLSGVAALRIGGGFDGPDEIENAQPLRRILKCEPQTEQFFGVSEVVGSRVAEEHLRRASQRPGEILKGSV